MSASCRCLLLINYSLSTETHLLTTALTEFYFCAIMPVIFARRSADRKSIFWSNGLEIFLVNYLMFFLAPLWLVAGFADWYCHYKARIEHSSGVAESYIHLLMLLEMGTVALAVLFFEINALIILLAIIAFLAHEATSLWDVSFATRHRKISPFEQHVHSFLEIIPLMALSCLVLLHWNQFLVLLGSNTEPADFALRPKSQPLPVPYITALLIAIVLLQILPYAQELMRSLAARRERDLLQRNNLQRGPFKASLKVKASR
jgi:hypothetical protein